MAQKQLKDMADRGFDKMSEDAGYVLHELKHFAASLESKLDREFVTKDDIMTLNTLVDKLNSDTRLDDLIRDYQQRLTDIEKIPELVRVVNILANS